MKRRAILYVVDCEEKRFDGYQFREQLPFVPAPLPMFPAPESERGKRRADYSLKDALALRLMLELNNHGGIAVEAASYAAGNSHHHLVLASERSEGSDIWLAYLQNDPTEECDFVIRALCAGTLDELPNLIRAKADPEQMPRVTILNASAASRFVKKRAAELDVGDESDDRPIWLLPDAY